MYFKHLLNNSPSRTAAKGKRKVSCNWIPVEGPLPENLWEKSVHLTTVSNGIYTIHVRQLDKGIYLQTFTAGWVFRPCIEKE